MAHHCGIRVFAFSLITNECILEDDSNEIANHVAVIATANQRQDELRTFVSRMIIGINQTIKPKGTAASLAEEEV